MSEREREQPEEQEEDPRNGEWHELGSDQLMDFQVLQRVRHAGLEADRQRQRKIERRGE